MITSLESQFIAMYKDTFGTAPHDWNEAQIESGMSSFCGWRNWLHYDKPDMDIVELILDEFEKKNLRHPPALKAVKAEYHRRSLHKFSDCAVCGGRRWVPVVAEHPYPHVEAIACQCNPARKQVDNFLWEKRWDSWYKADMEVRRLNDILHPPVQVEITESTPVQEEVQHVIEEVQQEDNIRDTPAVRKADDSAGSESGWW